MLKQHSDNYHQHKSLRDEKEKKAVVAEVTESRTIPTTSTTSMTQGRRPPSQPPMNTGKQLKKKNNESLDGSRGTKKVFLIKNSIN